MELKLGATVNYFLWSLAAGIMLAFIYDFLRSSRRIFNASVFSVNLEDIIFFLFSGALVFWIAYDKNNGMLRFQGFFGVFLGFMCYRKIFRDRLVCFMVWIADLVKKVFVFLIKIISFPIQILLRIMSKPFLVIGWYSRQGINRAETIARTVARKRKMVQKSTGRQKKNKVKRKEKHRRQK